VTLAVGGCTGDNEPITSTELPELVLKDADVSGLWRAFDRGRQVRADRVPGAREDPTRFGRIDGWKSRYRRPGTSETRGALVLDSRADLFPSAEAAGDDIEAYEQEFSAEVAELGGTRLDRIELGEESVVVTYTQAGAARAVRFYRLAWRRSNATASLTVNGFDGRLALGDALALARKQDARLVSAANFSNRGGDAGRTTVSYIRRHGLPDGRFVRPDVIARRLAVLPLPLATRLELQDRPAPECADRAHRDRSASVDTHVEANDEASVPPGRHVDAVLLA
jgi:hypothetical protein